MERESKPNSSSADNLVRLAYSAPGKALLAGGYLVLDQTYSAYVVALSARMHAIIQGPNPGSSPRKQDGITTVTIDSPQFLHGHWEFQVSTSGSNAYQAQCSNGSQKNPFLQAAITVAMSYLQPSSNTNISITIFSDDAYHSQENSVSNTNTSSAKKIRFNSHSSPIQDVPKTGLGSSAALTTVVTAALVGYYRTIADKPPSSSSSFSSSSSLGSSQKALDPTSREDLNVIHNLSQLAHCTAQGKIGSGFDVGSAVYGSIVYRRFPSTALVPVIDLGNSINAKNQGSANTQGTTPFCKMVKTLVDSPQTDSIWSPLKHDPCSMPPGISLLMGDVCGGSETPKLVSTVLQWRKDKPEEANALWNSLNAANMAFVKTLTQLQTLFEKDAAQYAKLLDKYASFSAGNFSIPISSNSDCNQNDEGNNINIRENENDDLILQLKKNIFHIRRHLKQMTKLSNVPIEPDSQTELINRCTVELPGVLGGVVPGAGGFDAIALVVVSKSVDEIKLITQNINNAQNLSSGSGSSEKESGKMEKKGLPISWLELREQSRGLVEERFDNSDYQNFKKVN